MELKDKIQNWYRGKYIPPPENDPNSPIVIISAGWYKKSISAKIVEFHLKHWAKLFPMYIAIIGIIVSAIVATRAIDKSNTATKENDAKQEQMNTHQKPPKTEKPANQKIKRTGNTSVPI